MPPNDKNKTNKTNTMKIYFKLLLNSSANVLPKLKVFHTNIIPVNAHNA